MTYRNAFLLTFGAMCLAQLGFAFSLIVLLGTPFHYALLACMFSGMLAGLAGPFITNGLTKKEEETISD